MYNSFYQLKTDPFRLSPDPRFCFRHQGYRKARSYMLFALHRGEGFVVVTGRPGTGKSTLIEDLLGGLKGKPIVQATLVSTQLQADDLLRMVAYNLGIKSVGGDKASVLSRLTEFFLESRQRGRQVLLIVDEAQDLPANALEELRLLTNLQTDSQPLLQIFLVGQEALGDMIRARGMEQLHQRIIAACHLGLLDGDETRDYIRHRLSRAGWWGDPCITDAAFLLIHRFSGGIPRRINLICSRLFLHGSVEEKHELRVEDVRSVVSELRDEGLDAVTDDRHGEVPAEVRDAILADVSDHCTVEHQVAKAYQQPVPVREKGQPPRKVDIEAGEAERPVGNPVEATTEPPVRPGLRDRESSVVAALGAGDLANSAGAPPPGNQPDRRATDSVASAVQRGGEPPIPVKDGRGERAESLGMGRRVERSVGATVIPRSEDASRTASSEELREQLRHAEELDSAGKTRRSWWRVGILLLVGAMIIVLVLFLLERERMAEARDGLAVYLQAAVAKVAASWPLQTTADHAGSTERVAVSSGHAVDESRNLAAAAGKVGRSQVQGIVDDALEGNPSPVPEPVAENGAGVGSAVRDKAASEPVVTEGLGVDAVPGGSAKIDPLDNLRASLRGMNLSFDEMGDGSLKLNLREAVPFGFDSAEITATAAKTLTRLASVLRGQDQLALRILGHTDRSGNEAYNLFLSEKRARAVADFLTDSGVTAGIEVQGMGSGMPAVASEEADRHLNRRTELFIRNASPL